MKKTLINICLLVMTLLGLPAVPVVQAQDGGGKSPLSVTVMYNLVNNQVPFVVATLKTKVDKKFTPVEGMEVLFYLDNDPANGGKLLGKAKTNNKGRVSMGVPATFNDAWKAVPTHKIVAVTAKTAKFDETSTDASIVKSKITLDTADDKNVKLTFSEWKDDKWSPVKGVEFKIGVKRLLSELGISEAESYTTDSLGQITAEFKITKLPGDEKGNLTLVAKAEDNDTYGNLRFEKTVPWGVKPNIEGGAIGRALWGGRFHSPVWLMFIAYSIVLGVWGTLIYLIFMIFRIRAIGMNNKNGSH